MFSKFKYYQSPIFRLQKLTFNNSNFTIFINFKIDNPLLNFLKIYLLLYYCYFYYRVIRLVTTKGFCWLWCREHNYKNTKMHVHEKKTSYNLEFTVSMYIFN